jgi:hypothetical protein
MRRGRQGLLGEQRLQQYSTPTLHWWSLPNKARVGVQTLGQMMAMQPQFGVSSHHLGVIFMLDRCVRTLCC